MDEGIPNSAALDSTADDDTKEADETVKEQRSSPATLEKIVENPGNVSSSEDQEVKERSAVADEDEEEEEVEGEELTERQKDAYRTTEIAANMSVSFSKHEPSSSHCQTEDIGTGTENIAEPRSNLEPTSATPTLPYNSDAAATVRFLLMPSQQVATQRCHLNQTITELKLQFATEMKIAEEMLLVMFEGKSTSDTSTLGDLGVVPNGTVQLELHSSDPVNHPIKLFRPRQEYHMPDVITVRIHIDTVQYRDIVVEIERATNKKPFLGGYRHKVTGVEYHHATAQTVPKPRPPSGVERFCRDTQTMRQRHAVAQTNDDTSTQMTKIGTYVSNQRDKLIEPRQYTTADDYHKNAIKQVITIQKYYRRWLAKRRVEKVRQAEKRRREQEALEEMNKKMEKENRIKCEFERRMNPKTKEDFDLLYHALEKWRQEELARINATLTGAERKAALCQLLDQETQLIASIGRHKIDANTENRQLFINSFLEKTSAPKRWRSANGKTTEMDTPYTMRARQLRDIYNSINMKYLTQDERLDALLTLKHTVKEHDCKLTKEIIELVDREADLLIRGVKEVNLDGLRTRISMLFLQYIKTPLFNPEAARFLKVPQDPSVLRKNIYYCTSCSQYLPSTEFQLSSNSKSVGRCRQCCKVNNDACRRQDYSLFSFILQSVCLEEEAYNDGSQIAFLMQEKDIRYLVDNVWDSQSCLSACKDLYELSLVRWDRSEQWSPWNCVLLTKDEATAHDKLDDLEQAYGKEFIHRVKRKHTLAKNYFFRLPHMAEYMRTRADSAAVSTSLPPLSGKRVLQLSA